MPPHVQSQLCLLDCPRCSAAPTQIKDPDEVSECLFAKASCAPQPLDLVGGCSVQGCNPYRATLPAAGPCSGLRGANDLQQPLRCRLVTDEPQLELLHCVRSSMCSGDSRIELSE